MKRCVWVLLAAVALTLGAGVAEASATGLPNQSWIQIVTTPDAVTGGQTVDQSQGNVSDQQQIQVVPIAPQVNVQNLNVLTFDDVEQGNANNANTGQATQQENTQVAVQDGSGTTGGGQSQTGRQGQGNASDQGQIQFIPIAPQANAQNVNILTFGEVSQGNVNNANTGQATQQQNTQVAVQRDGTEDRNGCGCSSRQNHGSGGGESIRQGQGNSSEQQQIQVVPIAPQVNVQNVNVLTFDDVEQGNANNANTGQATQQENTQVAVQDGSGTTGGGQSQTGRQGQGNASDQGQIQFIPIAPQVNVQNVNVLTFDDVSQGNANNANTGQATQQENTQVAVQDGANRSVGGWKGFDCNCSDKWEPKAKPNPCACSSWHPHHRPHHCGGCSSWHPRHKPHHCGCSSWHWQPKHHCTCSPIPSSGSGKQSIRQSQRNWSQQKQVQFIPIAPQANAQNVNILTFGDVSQGDVNNANTGQATQQQNTQVAVQKALLRRS